MEPNLDFDLPQLSAAIRKLATASSSHFGADCYIHSALAQAILARLGIASKLVAGYAGWRVGDGDDDVILHKPVVGIIYQEGATAYHVWLEIGGNILDLTTYQLRDKAAQLDGLDGGTTNVLWCPDYLFVPKTSASPLRDVIELHAGLFYYSQELEVEAKIISNAPALDEGDVGLAWMLYRNKDVAVFGPNTFDICTDRG